MNMRYEANPRVRNVRKRNMAQRPVLEQQVDATGDLHLLIESYEKQVFDLKQLIEISKSLNSTLDYHILIDSILYTCMGQMKVLKAAIFTRKDFDMPDFTLHRNFKGFEINHLVEYAIPENHPVIRFLSRTSRCFTLEELHEISGCCDNLDALDSLEPSLIVPLKAKGYLMGLIVLGERINGEPFCEAEKEYLLNIAMLAGIAIHNAFLFEMTNTDMMTKLKLRHFFLSNLIEQQVEAAATGKHLSIIMMDIDFFKVLNDTYGHTCGDYVLKQVARLIMKSVRQIDLAARYGGEEFIVLLPDTDGKTAKRIAERIRNGIQKEVYEYDDNRFSVTISMGVAEYDPVRDTTTGKFIDRADKALYYSKQNGRNRVTLAE
jgi:two-component system cell cycle response regulator